MVRSRAWGSRTRAAAVTAVALAGALAGALPASAATQAPAASSLKPPPVTVLTDQGGERGGDLFVSPFGDSGTYANGAEILSPDGKRVVWFHPVPAGQEAADFRAQRYRGQPVLT